MWILLLITAISFILYTSGKLPVRKTKGYNSKSKERAEREAKTIHNYIDRAGDAEREFELLRREAEGLGISCSYITPDEYLLNSQKEKYPEYILDCLYENIEQLGGRVMERRRDVKS